MFNVKVDNIHEVVNLETNYCVLIQDRVIGIYQGIKEKDNDLINPLTLN